MKRGFLLHLVVFIVMLFCVTNSFSQTIKETLLNAPEYTTFTKALSLTNTLSLLDINDTYIIFAPTNEAFSKMPDAVQKQIFEPNNIEKLKDIVNYHLVSSPVDVKAYLNELQGNLHLKAINGLDIQIQLCPEDCLSIIDANGFGIGITSKTQVGNATIYSIEEVLLPQIDVKSASR